MSAPWISRDERAAIITGMLAHGRASAGSSWVKVPCGFCPIRVGKQDSDRSFAYNRATTGYVCFRCGIKGYVDSENVPEHFAKVPLGPTDVQLAKLRKPPLGYEPIWPGTEGFTAWWTEEARAHLRKRGIPEELWKTAQIGYSNVKWEKSEVEGEKAKYNLAYGRVIVPLLADGGWMGWSGRAVWKDVAKKDKYRLQKHPEFVLYNHDAILVQTEEPVYVVEGVMDALAYWPDAVAVCGDVTEHQLDVLAAAKRPVVFVPDGDAWEKGLARMCRLRLDEVRCGCVRLPPKKDPDEVPKYELWEAARASITADREVSL